MPRETVGAVRQQYHCFQHQVRLVFASHSCKAVPDNSATNFGDSIRI